jgi:hypothetical protein
MSDEKRAAPHQERPLQTEDLEREVRANIGEGRIEYFVSLDPTRTDQKTEWQLCCEMLPRKTSDVIQ